MRHAASTVAKTKMSFSYCHERPWQHEKLFLMDDQVC